MAILVLGAGGMQGRAILHDLSRCEEVSRIIAADLNITALQEYLKSLSSDKIRGVEVDASDESSVSELMNIAGEVVIDALPLQFSASMARLAVKNNVNLVSINYLLDPAETNPSKILSAKEELHHLDLEAQAKGVTILPEFGLDPGIDLVFCGQAVRELDEIHELYSYGAGFPEPQAANNPLKYKITWSFDNVLRSYCRPARILQHGHIVEIPAEEIFAPRNTHVVNLEGLGHLEAFPNGDAVKYAEILGIRNTVKTMGRFVLRWPGHCEFWKKLVDLHFLDDKPIQVGASFVIPREFLCSLLKPQLQYAENERDIAVIRVDARGVKDSEKKRIIYQVIDRRDLATGFTAMSRTTGYTASIGAQMILRGDIEKPGILSPAKDVPFETFINELQKRNIHVDRFVL